MALGRLFSALPVRQGDPADQVEVYVFSLEGVSHYALDAVVAQAIRGQHPKLSRKFAPTTAELGEAIADEMAAVQRQIELAEERRMIADNRTVPLKRPSLQERVDAAKAKMAEEGRELICEVPSHAASVSVRRSMPAGSVYVGILCAWYGPPRSGAAAEPVQDEKPRSRSDDVYADYKRLLAAAREAEKGHIETPVNHETASYWRQIEALPDRKRDLTEDESAMRCRVSADLDDIPDAPQSEDPAPAYADVEF